MSALSQLARGPGAMSNGRPEQLRRGREGAMRALRVVWDPRPTAGLPSSFTSALGTDRESLREGIPSQRMVHHQRHALLSPNPVLWPSGAIASKFGLFCPGADNVGATQALRVVRPTRAATLICFDRRACRRPMPVRGPVMLPARATPMPSGSDAVLTS